MKKGEKRGLSPVIATVLLISVALVLAVIIFFWARSFIGENVQKDGQKIELVCDQVSFRAEAIAGTSELLIENTGGVPIYSIEINLIGAGEISEVQSADSGSIGPGETKSFTLPDEAQVDDTLVIVPILLGESQENSDYVAKICDEDYGVEARVNP